MILKFSIFRLINVDYFNQKINQLIEFGTLKSSLNFYVFNFFSSKKPNNPNSYIQIYVHFTNENNDLSHKKLFFRTKNY